MNWPVYALSATTFIGILVFLFEENIWLGIHQYFHLPQPSKGIGDKGPETPLQIILRVLSIVLIISSEIFLADYVSSPLHSRATFADPFSLFLLAFMGILIFIALIPAINDLIKRIKDSVYPL